MKKLTTYSLVLALYAALAVLHTWPMALHMGEATPGSFNTIPTGGFMAEQAILFLQEHPFSLHKAFDPGLTAPLESPFLFLGIPFGLSQIFGLFFLPTQNLHFAINGAMLFMLIGSAFSMFFLAQYLMQSARAGVVAGVVFSFTAATQCRTVDFIDMNMVIVPWIVLFLFKYIHEDKSRHLYIAVGLLALQFYMYFYHCLFAVYLMAAIVIWRRKRFFTKEHIPAIAGAGFMGVLLILPLALPYLQTMVQYRLDQMTGSSESLFSYTFAYSPSEWFNAAKENLLYGAWLAQEYEAAGFPDFPHAALFPGVLVWYLVLTGAGRMPRERISPWFLTGVLAFAVLASTGWKPLQFFRWEMSEALVLRHLSQILPLGSIIRNPTRLVVFYTFALALLTAGAFAGFEQRILKAKGKAAAAILIAVVIAVITVENLSIPRPMYNFDALFGPSQSDFWLAENNPLTSPEESILHIPSKERLYQYDEGVPPARLYVESNVGLYRHLWVRQTSANSHTSFLPRDFILPETRRLPSLEAQEYLYAQGVRLLVVHESLLYGKYKERFSRESMAAQGFDLLASFDDGDAIYAMHPNICTANRLIILPVLENGRLEVLGLTPSLFDAMLKQEPVTPCFWLNPKTCRSQTMWATFSDRNGKLRRKKYSYHLPLVVKGNARLIEDDLAADGLKGPFSMVSLEWNEPYLTPPPGVEYREQ
ncbi:hypothetical protein Dalk_4958 [Desulfatibacillum aliphaticivorans]|uniref:Uncharacterized protein n=1 Tax=Desulfatibacillum aliphaticivorans TaxID=218208 RepID=B8FDJ9_DESAL|nr:hypothetical protein [Desulfatibacillum aliphaticivorans]ACL06630.1 hypothetical protein Dalk_4958 [Desulfatibacillum aliphaticivorans]